MINYSMLDMILIFSSKEIDMSADFQADQNQNNLISAQTSALKSKPFINSQIFWYKNVF